MLRIPFDLDRLASLLAALEIAINGFEGSRFLQRDVKDLRSDVLANMPDKWLASRLSL